jgi:hypothetical protein
MEKIGGYWFEHDTKKRSEQLMYARGVVMNVNKYECRGKARVEARLICFHLEPLNLCVCYI